MTADPPRWLTWSRRLVLVAIGFVAGLLLGDLLIA